MKHLWVVAVLAVIGPVSHRPAVPSIPPVPVIVELFTSEGCSSCPPADDLLARLAEDQAVPGATVLALEEHVDYWDQQGWKDPFSSHEFTARQDAYATVAGTSSIYTPEMVVDGADGFVGSDRAAAIAAMTKAAAAPTIPVVLSWRPDSVLHVVVAPAQSRAQGRGPRASDADADIWLALTEDRLVSRVTAGENGGRTLRHAAVVRRLARIGQLTSNGPEATGQAPGAPAGGVTLDVAIHVAAGWTRAAMHAVVFLQEPGPGRIFGAASIALR